ncbi:MAG: hypothetical protein O7C59_06060 [Rickettsia endosymbiont of Ixodes persulcatus]|nr:hypothetical protein [Rickettsia endosymbiont of Ixodes persulcatus]
MNKRDSLVYICNVVVLEQYVLFQLMINESFEIYLKIKKEEERKKKKKPEEEEEEEEVFNAIKECSYQICR